MWWGARTRWFAPRQACWVRWRARPCRAPHGRPLSTPSSTRRSGRIAGTGGQRGMSRLSDSACWKQCAPTSACGARAFSCRLHAARHVWGAGEVSGRVQEDRDGRCGRKQAAAVQRVRWHGRESSAGCRFQARSLGREIQHRFHNLQLLKLLVGCLALAERLSIVSIEIVENAVRLDRPLRLP